MADYQTSLHIKSRKKFNQIGNVYIFFHDFILDMFKNRIIKCTDCGLGWGSSFVGSDPVSHGAVAYLRLPGFL